MSYLSISHGLKKSAVNLYEKSSLFSHFTVAAECDKTAQKKIPEIIVIKTYMIIPGTLENASICMEETSINSTSITVKLIFNILQVMLFAFSGNAVRARYMKNNE